MTRTPDRHPTLFATTNEHKLREVSAILGIAMEQVALELSEPQGVDVERVVREKAEDAFRKTGAAVLVEDTGLEFAAWNGLPGALVKWFVESVGNEGILRMMQGEQNRAAIAKTAIGFYDGTETRVFVGVLSGAIAERVRGANGFGWDPIFIPDGHHATFAEMSAEEKNALSMRRQAVEAMKESLQ